MDTGQPTPASTWLQTTNPAALATWEPSAQGAPASPAVTATSSSRW